MPQKSSEELDALLTVLSNHTRRRIMRKLVQETHYALQLSKELRVSQQAICKHLTFMEKKGLVRSRYVPAPEGPPRKMYEPSRNFTITISIGPGIFDTSIKEMGDEEIREYTELREDFRKILHSQNYKERILMIYDLLSKLNKELSQLDRKRMELMRIKQDVLNEANSLINDLYDEYLHRSVLYTLMQEGDRSVEEISQTLDLRENIIRRIIQELEEDEVLV